MLFYIKYLLQLFNAVIIKILFVNGGFMDVSFLVFDKILLVQNISHFASKIKLPKQKGSTASLAFASQQQIYNFYWLCAYKIIYSSLFFFKSFYKKPLLLKV